MIYISLLLDAVSIILSFVIINFLYKTYIELKGRTRMEIDNFEQSGNMEPVDEIVYANPPEDEVDDIEEIDISEEVISDEYEDMDKKAVETVVIPINTEENVFMHSNFGDNEVMQVPLESEMSRRRRLALKLSKMNNDD